MLTRLSASDSSQTAFDWLGDLPVGKSVANRSLRIDPPLREAADYDGFGRRTGWTYSAGSQTAPPVLQIDAIRDVTGRIRSMKTEFGHPLTMGTHDVDWRGYQYDRRGYLKREWRSIGPSVDTMTIESNGQPLGMDSVDAALDSLGGDVGATPWDQERDLEVGNLTAIRNANDPSDVLWSITTPRDPGHRLSEVQLDQTTYAVAHDSAGRLTSGLDLDFVYDPNNRLAAAKLISQGVEHYLYTADGDLAGVFDASGDLTRFAYDGTRIVAAFDDTLTPLWEATYGDGIDQLVEYRDFAARGPVVPLVDNRNSPVATWNPARQSIEGIARWDVHGRLTLLDGNEFEVCAEPGNAGTICDSPSGMPFAFNGRWRSPVTGLVNMRARWYSPRLGQFTAPDPLGYVDTYNLYGFAAHDPVNGWDPWGLASLDFTPDPGQCLLPVMCEAHLRAPMVDKQPHQPPAPESGSAIEGGLKQEANNMTQTLCLLSPLAGWCATTPGAGVMHEIRGEREQAGADAAWWIRFALELAAGGKTVAVRRARDAPRMIVKSTRGVPNKGTQDRKVLDKLIVRFRNVSGNKTIDGALTREQAEYLGRRWVGDGHRTVTTSKGHKILISRDGTRQYRSPTAKRRSPYTSTGTQANYQHRPAGQTAWKNNAHVDIVD